MTTTSASSRPAQASSSGARRPPARLTSGQVASRSVRVGLVRKLLIGLTGLVLVGFVAGVIWSVSKSPVTIEEADVEGDSIVISNPRFVGRTETGERVTIVADRVVRRVGPIRLDKPVMTSADGTSATGTTGLWTPQTQTLNLDGDVVFTLDRGQVARAARAIWQPEAGSSGKAGAASVIAMEGGVEVETAEGDRMNSESARWHDGLRTIDLEGGVVINRASGDTATGANARWDTAQQILQMSGSARISLSGTTAEAGQIILDQARGVVTGVGASRITGALGTVTAERFQYTAATRRLQLNGRVRGNLEP
jgi:hypothetical protein